MKVESIKRLREKYKLSQEDLAAATGITRWRIAKWEQGKGKPKADDVETLANFFAKKSGEQVPKDEPDGLGKETIVSDSSPAPYKLQNKQTDKIIEDLAASSRDHAAADLKRAEAEVLREQNHKRIIDHITGSASEENPITLSTILVSLQEILVDLGTGAQWDDRDAAQIAVHNKLFSRLKTKTGADMKNS